MTKPSASAVAGDTITTHNPAGVTGEVPTAVLVDASGNIIGTKDSYLYSIANMVFVNTASNPAWDIFNADAALIVRVHSILFIPDITTAVTGVLVSWLLEKSTAVGTGGTAQTVVGMDSNDTALDADITCRIKPTGGATAGADIRPFTLSSEETATATIDVASAGGLELVPAFLRESGKGIVLRQNQGLRLTQVTATAAGNAAHIIGFTVE